MFTVIILNLLFTANLDTSEHITINYNNIIYILGLVLASFAIFFITKYFNKFLNKSSNPYLKKDLLLFFTAIYILLNILWPILVIPGIGADQVHVANLAQTFYSGDAEKYLPNLTYASIPLSQYASIYTQQIPLAFVYSLFFKLIHCDFIVLLRILNVIGNILIVAALYKINCHLSKKYETNKVLLFTLIFTFASLPMLTTFVYGDIPSIGLGLFAIYYIMKYGETKKIKYAIISALFMMVAYMMRMNSLIFIIAITIYFILNLFKEANVKKVLLGVLVIALYLSISIFPSNLVQDYFLNKFNLTKIKHPTITYFLMGMEESYRAPGWYIEEIGEKALKHPNDVKDEYFQRIKDRLGYFSQHIDYAFRFYVTKLSSMWTENTYSAVMQNMRTQNDSLQNAITPLTFYQKALLIVTCMCSLIVLIQNRKNLSYDLILLVTIFIGGFAFHILWEAKSRYIIPYIIVLIPVASLALQNSYNSKAKTKNKAV